MHRSEHPDDRADRTSEAMLQLAIDRFLGTLTLLVLIVGFSLYQQRTMLGNGQAGDVPAWLVAEVKQTPAEMERARVDDRNPLPVARSSHWIDRLGRITYAVTERSGGIPVVSRQGG